MSPTATKSTVSPTKTNTTVSALEETIQKVESSLLPAIESYSGKDTTKNNNNNNRGLDFLHVKNTLLLSYIIDLIVHLRDTATLQEYDSSDNDENEIKSSESEKEDEINEDEQEIDNKSQHEVLLNCRRRLLEMRTVLDKTRSLDKKLRYQIDKLLAAAASTSSSAAFATIGIPDVEEDENQKQGSNLPMSTGPEDPLQFRPDPQSLLDDVDDEDGARFDSEQSSHDDDDEDDEDDDRAAAREAIFLSNQSKSSKTKSRKNKYEQTKQANSKEDNDNAADDDNEEQNMIYRAPRLTAVPYTHDVQNKLLEKEKRERRRLRASELAQTLRDQYGEGPDQEDIHGGGNTDLYGKQRAASRKLAQQEAERTEYEESAMIRLTTSRKEKKEKKRIERMMEGGSNLSQIANVGNLVRETEAFGKSGDIHEMDDDGMDEDEAFENFRKSQKGNIGNGSSARHANGKRRRESIENTGFNQGGKKNVRLAQAKNSLQAALYGGSSGSKKAKKRTKR